MTLTHERLKDRDPDELTPEDGPGRSAMIRMELTAKYSASGDYRGVRQDVATAVWDGKPTRQRAVTAPPWRSHVSSSLRDVPTSLGKPAAQASGTCSANRCIAWLG